MIGGADEQWATQALGGGAATRCGDGHPAARADGEGQAAAVGNQTAGRVGFFLRVDDFDASYERMRTAVSSSSPRHATRPTDVSPCSSTSPATDGTCSAPPDRYERPGSSGLAPSSTPRFACPSSTSANACTASATTQPSSVASEDHDLTPCPRMRGGVAAADEGGGDAETGGEQGEIGVEAGRHRSLAGRPSTRAGVAVTVAIDSAGEHPVKAMRFPRPRRVQRTPGQRAVLEPHAVIAERDRPAAEGEPAGGRPSAATASVTRLRRDAPSARHAAATAIGWTWIPSAISPAVSRPSDSAMPIGPGSRWPKGAMPLNRCVT